MRISSVCLNKVGKQLFWTNYRTFGKLGWREFDWVEGGQEKIQAEVHQVHQWLYGFYQALWSFSEAFTTSAKAGLGWAAWPAEAGHSTQPNKQLFFASKLHVVVEDLVKEDDRKEVKGGFKGRCKEVFVGFCWV
ncbi:hypothetical protein PPACK8108_LOCUS11759 [Phakopsora pachyrhizi]|uniref:Uncharacterized protein n=1 Tax=Phakopsora pachyrhizi TaxID=170000 RepID=A0AAV0B2L2_PHAPC|nr:hypothetical protein PPACK8108_LOCUS11759 [Phakopsora pachyrhizi]